MRFLFRVRRVRKETPAMPDRRDPRESRENPALRVRKELKGNEGNEGNPERHSGLMRPDRWKISHSMMMRLPTSASSIRTQGVFT